MNVCMQVCVYVPDSRFANQREFGVLAAAQHACLFTSHTSHVTNELQHKRVESRKNHVNVKNKSCHEEVMARATHDTNE